MRRPDGNYSVTITHFGCYYKKLGIPTTKLIPKTSCKRDNKIMATYSLLLGIIVIIISWKFFNDWASGLAGFIYGGVLFWGIKLFIQLIKALFG